MKTSIIWFKTDLRLHDNEALTEAIKQSDAVIPVYCIDNAQLTSTKFGFRKTGKYRAKFLLESLHNLKHNLNALNADLLILRGKPEEEIFTIAERYRANKVFAKKEVGFEEIETQLKLEKALWQINCVVEVFSTSTLYHPSDLPFSIRDIPDVFTSFRKKVEKESGIRTVFDKPTKIPVPANLQKTFVPEMQELGFDVVHIDKRTAYPFSGGETNGLKRLNYYLWESNLISSYKNTRNGLIGKDYSSKLSAWLSLGCLSPREVYHELKRYEETHGANDSTYWLYFELLWRDFFRFMMKKYKQKLFTYNGISDKNAQPPAMNERALLNWVNGNTGNTFVDANMHELNATGYMSNRGRQNVASYLCHDLKLDWRYGAAYFEQQLIDYDECSNWSNWAYIAGFGNDPRDNRYFNTELQAHTYDKDFAYRKQWS